MNHGRVKRYRNEIVAENLILLDRNGAPEGGVVYDRKPQSSAVRPQQEEPAGVPEEMTPDDLSFRGLALVDKKM